jgi:hypothetical protein
MPFNISYLSLTYSRSQKSESRFGGSSCFRVVDDELKTRKKRDTRNFRPSFKTNQLNNEEANHLLRPFEDTPNLERLNNDEENAKSFTNIENEDIKQIRHRYKLNKTKVKRKCHAFSRLKKSKKFLAFYTLSFPKDLCDNVCYKVFNTWLTRCRRDSKLESYIWVAERQKNGTIHFHLLTNDFMDIKAVNNFMAKALATEKRKGTEALKNVEIEKYNGVDVKRVKGSSKGFISYLAKYVSKNNIEFYRLPWHCSRDISKLFTSEYFEKEDSDRFFNHLPKEADKYKIFQSEFYNTASFNFTPNDLLYCDIDSVNETIYNS